MPCFSPGSPQSTPTKTSKSVRNTGQMAFLSAHSARRELQPTRGKVNGPYSELPHPPRPPWGLLVPKPSPCSLSTRHTGLLTAPARQAHPAQGPGTAPSPWHVLATNVRMDCPLTSFRSLLESSLLGEALPHHRSRFISLPPPQLPFLTSLSPQHCDLLTC